MEITKEQADWMESHLNKIKWEYVKVIEQKILEIKAGEEDVNAVTKEEKDYLQDALLNKWQLSGYLADFHAAEQKAFAERLFKISDFDDKKKKGTQKIDIGNGYKLKATKAITYSFIKTENNRIDKKAIDEALNKIEILKPAGKFIADNLVSWTPALSVSNYDKLEADEKSIIDKVLIIKDKPAALELVEPK